MKANDIYKLNPADENYDLQGASYSFSFLFPELQHLEYNIDFEKLEESGKIKVKVYFHEPVDWGERSMLLSSLWWEDNPFMIFQNAGRGLKDEEHRFITDARTYMKAVFYIENYASRFKDLDNELVDPDKDIPDLTYFYYHEVIFEDGKFKELKG